MQLSLSFTERIQKQLPQGYEAFLQALKTDSPTSIRFNPKKGKLPTEERVPWTDYGFYLPSRPKFTLDPLLHAGAYYVQEASSMFLEQALKQSVDLTRSLKVLDLCAAPGGKSTHLVSLLNQQSLLVSNEVIRSRASILSENIQKWGYQNVVVSNNDPKDFQALPGFFDVIVVDAPCSGEGLFRKEPESAAEWSEENVNLCSLRQQRILSDVWPCLKKDGILIYSTCTYNEKENEENLLWLKRDKNAEFLSLQINDWDIEEIKREQALGYRFYPHRVKGEGFFLSVMRKTDEQEEISIRKKKSIQSPSKKVIEKLSAWQNAPEEKDLIQFDDLIISIPKLFTSEIELLSQALSLVQRGTALATVKHEKLIPEHALALSIELNSTNFLSVELNLASALSYLRKDTIVLDTAHRGFALVNYQGASLGFVNLLGNRINNLYPSSWRIRMAG